MEDLMLIENNEVFLRVVPASGETGERNGKEVEAAVKQIRAEMNRLINEQIVHPLTLALPIAKHVTIPMHLPYVENIRISTKLSGNR